ncbi:hypothetical protein [Methylocapsa aurea]|uniref:hypothetical protein n=1 Tax=Methylocapsa aurea TaxID=663610 RepID=UPI00068D9410|nr:hypothetical protein [Methylocapsa aurea]
MTSIGKKAAAAFTALALGLAVTVAATPSQAQGWHGGRHGGYGGWHGGHGGWHGGGGYWRGGRWYGGGYNWGAPVAAGILGGLALGAVAGAAYPYGGYAPAYGGCYMQNQPAYDGWGNFVGYRPVRVCY